MYNFLLFILKITIFYFILRINNIGLLTLVSIINLLKIYS